MPVTKASKCNSNDRCKICKKPVKWEDVAYECDGGSAAASTTHWLHAACLEREHLLLPQKIKVPLSHLLYEKLEGLEFVFMCHICSKGNLPPLPFQQGIISLQDFASFDLVTDELEPILLGSKSSKISKNENENPLAGEKPKAETALGSETSTVPQNNPESDQSATSTDNLVNFASPSGSGDQTSAVMMQGMMQLMQQQMLQFMSVLEKQNAENSRQLRFEREQSDAANLALQRELIEQVRGTRIDSSPGTSGLQQSRDGPSGFPKLPKIKIPVFKGDILEWSSFWDTFNEMVHKHSHFSEIEKMNFLLNILMKTFV